MSCTRMIRGFYNTLCPPKSNEYEGGAQTLLDNKKVTKEQLKEFPGIKNTFYFKNNVSEAFEAGLITLEDICLLNTHQLNEIKHLTGTELIVKLKELNAQNKVEEENFLSTLGNISPEKKKAELIKRREYFSSMSFSLTRNPKYHNN